MRKLPLILAATTALTFGAGAAAAQDWMPINARQAQLDDRIDAGLRSGQLTDAEARRLRIEFRELARLEARYRAGGLSIGERTDLDRRFDRLALQVRFERRDRQRDYAGARGWDDRAWFGGRGWTDNRGRWVDVNRRQRMLDRRIDQGLRSGQLTRAEAVRLRAEFRQIARIEQRYRRRGLTLSERADLDRRFDRLAMQVRYERRDRQRDYGWNRW